MKDVFSFETQSEQSYRCSHSLISLQPKTGPPLKISRVELVSTWMVKTRLLLEEVLVRPVGGAHPVICVDPNAPV